MWLPCVIGFAALFLLLAWRVRPSAAIGMVVTLTVCVPAWCTVTLFEQPVNVRLTVALVALGAYSFLPRAQFPWRLVPCDYAVLAFVAINLASDLWNSELSIEPFLFSYCEWVVPYLVGRLAIQRIDDLAYLWPTMVFVTFFLGGFAVLESISRVNYMENLFGLRPEEGFPLDAARWGLRRAYTSTGHPLYLGVLFCWLLGWCAMAFWRAADKRAKMVWMVAPFVAIALPLTTGSRAPVLVGLFVVIPVILMFALRWLRIPVAVVGGIALLLVAFNLEWTFSELDRWSGETSRGRKLREVTFQNKTEKISSARGRLTLFRIYSKPIRNAGFLGYGTESVTGFPVRVPLGIDEAKAAEQIWALDNTYILILLRFGYLGLFCFMAIPAIGIAQAIWVFSKSESRGVRSCCACLTASTIAIGISVFIVWLPMDLSFPWLFGVGITSGLYYMCREEQTERSLVVSKYAEDV